LELVEDGIIRDQLSLITNFVNYLSEDEVKDFMETNEYLEEEDDE